MSPHRIKIRIRQKIDSANRLRIDVKEKTIYVCKSCDNRYYSLHFFCPQCLGELAPTQPQVASLNILSVPRGREDEISAVLKQLSGKEEFDFSKALRSLPWIMMADIDSGLIQHWKEILEAEMAELEVRAFAPDKGRRRKTAPPLFSGHAPLPFFLKPRVLSAVRAVSKKLTNSGLRAKWIEAVLLASNILDYFYKKEPASRILFPDYLFQVEHLLQEATRDYQSGNKNDEMEFAAAIGRLRSSLQHIESEMHAVKRQVEDQL